LQGFSEVIVGNFQELKPIFSGDEFLYGNGADVAFIEGIQ